MKSLGLMLCACVAVNLAGAREILGRGRAGGQEELGGDVRGSRHASLERGWRWDAAIRQHSPDSGYMFPLL